MSCCEGEDVKVYISGPMKGIKDSNFPEFESAKIWLLKNTQFEVFSPHDCEKLPSYEDYMRADIKLLCECDIIVMLPGWRNSKGATLEKAVSDAIGNDTAYLRKHSPKDGGWYLTEEF